jgi:hypothetical protein
MEEATVERRSALASVNSAVTPAVARGRRTRTQAARSAPVKSIHA